MTDEQRKQLERMATSSDYDHSLAQDERDAISAARALLDKQAKDIAEMESVLHDARLDGQDGYERGVAAGREEAAKLLESQCNELSPSQSQAGWAMAFRHLSAAIRALAPVRPPILPERREALLAKALEALRKLTGMLDRIADVEFIPDDRALAVQRDVGAHDNRATLGDLRRATAVLKEAEETP